ncbi:hypothetical protein IWQ47_002820 [Aquimarina sp. EL_43]|nr:hypothetical protein [Aquimarina sp. EL_35]MBG6151806.1 hypothetical protein [Aquimarina sp. EL_32]MBG6169736.1 hypothetical protein [Aquimarina sp. EL_43]
MRSLPVQEIATCGRDCENDRVQTSKTNRAIMIPCSVFKYRNVSKTKKNLANTSIYKGL